MLWQRAVQPVVSVQHQQANIHAGARGDPGSRERGACQLVASEVDQQGAGALRRAGDGGRRQQSINRATISEIGQAQVHADGPATCLSAPPLRRQRTTELVAVQLRRKEGRVDGGLVSEAAHASQQLTAVADGSSPAWPCLPSAPPAC